MSNEDKPSIVSGPSGDPRSMWLTRSDVDKEAQWAANKKKIEKPGYSYVRHTTDEYVSGIRNASDGHAWGAMQLNLTDLRSAMGNTDAGFDDTEIQKELAAQAAKIEKNTQDISILKTGKADKDHTHDGIGNDYDDSWIRPALDKKSDLTHTHSSYSDLNHTHDTSHTHTEYQPKGDYASDVHGHIEYETKTDAAIVHDTLTQSIANKADSRHKHDGSYAPFVHEHALESHGHDDKYQAKGDYASDVHFHDEYAEANDLSSLEIKLDTEINDREAADEALEIKLDNHEHAVKSAAHVGNKPPQRPTEGDLWFLSDLYLAEGEFPIELSDDKLFVFADGKWEPATSLQHERRMREYGDRDTLEWAEEHADRSDAKYMTRIDKVLLPDPVFVNKGVVVHINGTIPPFNDDKVHFSDLTSKRDSSIAYKGEDPGPGIVYAIMSHDTNSPSPRREEWIVKEVNYNNGIVTIVTSDPYGNTNAHSESHPCTLWLLTEDDAKGEHGLLKRLDGKTTAITGVENFQSKGQLVYYPQTYQLGNDVAVYQAHFKANPAAVGLNHDLVGGGRIKWCNEFPVGSVLVIKGADATLAYEVTAVQQAGSNSRAQGFEGKVLLETGTFTDGEYVEVGTGDLVGGTQLLLDDAVVGDSEWEGRITTLEEESISAELDDLIWSDLGNYNFHRASDDPGSGILQCKVPGGAPYATKIEKVWVHKTNKNGVQHDLNTILKEGNFLKLSKGDKPAYYKIVGSALAGNVNNAEVDVEWLSGYESQFFYTDNIRVGEGVKQSINNHTHDDYATKIDLEELQVEIDALVTTREAGRWDIPTNYTDAPRPGQVSFASYAMGARNQIWLNETDLDGTVHKFAGLEVGDYLEVVQETGDKVGVYGLHVITEDWGSEGDVRTLLTDSYQSNGNLSPDNVVFIKIFHANNDLDLAELDQRYALKGHTHGGATLGRRFKLTTLSSPSDGHFYVAGTVTFSFTDLDGGVRKMNEGPEFQWTNKLRMTIWDLDGKMQYAAELRPSTDYSSTHLKLYLDTMKYDLGLESGKEYDVTVEGYW